MVVLHEHEFGGICIDISIDGFNALGFEFGDSVDITTADLSVYARDYLRACGMQEEQMEAFREKVFR